MGSGAAAPSNATGTTPTCMLCSVHYLKRCFREFQAEGNSGPLSILSISLDARVACAGVTQSLLSLFLLIYNISKLLVPVQGTTSPARPK
jgi:hypothetical protein